MPIGRPKKRKAERRAHTLKVRLTDAEVVAFEAAAKQSATAGLSAFARQAMTLLARQHGIKI